MLVNGQVQEVLNTIYFLVVHFKSLSIGQHTWVVFSLPFTTLAPSIYEQIFEYAEITYVRKGPVDVSRSLFFIVKDALPSHSNGVAVT